jgi:hypothetical protein
MGQTTQADGDHDEPAISTADNSSIGVTGLNTDPSAATAGASAAE